MARRQASLHSASQFGSAVHVDREMWEKIVLNLLSNALKHTFELLRAGTSTVEALLAEADALMYERKRGKRNALAAEKNGARSR